MILDRVSTDKGSEVRNRHFDEDLDRIDALKTLDRPGPPPLYSFMESVQRTNSEEYQRLALACHLAPRYTGLRRELECYLWE